MKANIRRRTGVTHAQAGPANISDSTFGNNVSIVQGNVIIRDWRYRDSSHSNKPSSAVQARLQEKEKMDCRRSLSFRDLDARLHNISPVQPGTCGWVIELSLFRKWYDPSEHDNGLLWIKGNPGTGKSTLMKHILEYCQIKKEYAMAAYFFNARGAELEQTPLGMLRSLLFQLLDQEPCLYDQLLPKFRKNEQDYRSGDWVWREPELKNFFLSAVSKGQSGPLLLIIDALDECGEDDVQKVAEFLQDLRNNAVDAELTLKICLSSRHYPFIRFKEYQELVLEKEEKHNEDITIYISSNLTKRDEEIGEAIRKKSSGIFLWVVLVIAILNRAYEDGRVEAMKDTLDEIPSQLGDVFAMMLDRNNPNKDETILILQFILFAKRPLTPEEMFFAIIAGTKSQALGIWDPLQITPDIIRRRIVSSSRGLVEIRKGEGNKTTQSDQTFFNDIEGPKSKLLRKIELITKTHEGKKETIQFIHETVNDFLVRDHRLQRLDPRLMPNPVAKSHDRLKDCCMSYLIMQSLEQQNIKRMESSFPFLEYASRYLFDHAEEATSEGQAELLRALKDDNIFKRVERFHNYFMDYGQRDASLNLLQVLAARELPKLVGILLDEGADINAKGVPSGTALEAAIEFGSEQTAKTLLGKRAKVNHHANHGDSLLCKSLRYDNKEIIAMLIKGGARLSISERLTFGSVLHQAAAYGNEDVVAMVLDQGAKVNAYSIGGTALGLAAFAGHLEVMEMLIEKGANVNAGQLLGTSLTLAVLDEQLEAAEMLIEKGAKIDPGGILGSPLQMAIIQENKPLVEMLLNKGANVNAWGGLFGNALQIAAMSGDSDIVKMLLAKGANINARGFIGLVSIITDDSSNFDEKKIQEMLLTKGMKTSIWGKIYGTALQAAAAKRHGEIVQLLLDRGANR